MSSLIQNVDFNIIRYANCWEDADVLLEGLALPAGKRVLSIASAGDNSLALLTTHPAKIDAIDVSRVQLYLVELKRAAFECLAYEEVLALLGLTATIDRDMLFQKIKGKLTDGAKVYWQEHKKMIEQGIIYAGKFEQYFAFFRNRLLPWVHGQERTEQLLVSKTDEEQEVFFKNEWNTWRWKLLMSVFFSRYVMGKYGRDPEFMKHLDMSVSQYIRQKAEQHLQSAMAPDNYFLRMIFTGTFGSQMPCYLRPENFDVIKKNIHRMELSQVSADEAVRLQKYDAYNLSNVFEYMSPAEFKYLSMRWMPHIPQGSKLGYWNLMAYRVLSGIVPEAIRYKSRSEKLSRKDKGFFYSRFVVEEKI